MNDMQREGQTHASRTPASETLALAQLEATFEAALADAVRADARLTELQQTWLQRKPLPPRVLRATSNDAAFGLCYDNEVGSYYTIRDLPALHELAKTTPHLWHRVQTITAALQRYQHDTSRLADELGLAGAHQERAACVEALHNAGNALLQEPATSMAVLTAKARVLAWSLDLNLKQDPWSPASLNDRALLVLIQDLLNPSPALRASA
ncbi:hypothetical protein [Microvirga sp. M2]|uniref:hypothetical protein n=1 Tax=Microvirga sp. M2 TaxID=3073270 RepID=UPI0039C0F6B7